jgi:CubicO group peptidase (beta-lactamase class C family)
MIARSIRLFVTALAVMAFSTTALAVPANRLVGLWGAEVVRTPGLHGILTVRREARSWQGTIANVAASAPVRGDAVRIAFPNERGEFRGTLAKDGRALTGFWIQPRTTALQSFASPLSLKKTGSKVWRANVIPFDDRFTLYLAIAPAADGALTAAFRNPEQNSIGNAPQFSLTHDGDALRFSAKSGAGEVSHDGQWLSAPDRIRIRWPELGRTLELVRRSPAEARSFYPRLPGQPPYAYRRPSERGDGWKTARAAEVGIDEAALTRVIQTIATSDPAARRPSLIHSLLLARHGRLVLEEYFFGYGADSPHDVRSAGKTFASVLMGAEMRRGVPIQPSTPVYALLRPMGPFANPDPRKARITLAHLMTHSTGLACDDNDDASPGNEEKLQDQTAQPNWWKYTLDLPQLHDPGVRYAYCSATMNLMGAALTTAGRSWLPEMFARDIAKPLQFGRWYWNLMPTGEGYIGGGADLLPRDLLKIGQTYLNGGRWNGRRIVTADWVSSSTKPRIEITPATTGMSEEDFGNSYIKGADGLAWHRITITAGDRRIEGYSAGGNGGQLLLIFPELDLTAVFTGGNYGQGGIWLRWPQQIIGDLVVPALKS